MADRTRLGFLCALRFRHAHSAPSVGQSDGYSLRRTISLKAEGTAKSRRGTAEALLAARLT